MPYIYTKQYKDTVKYRVYYVYAAKRIYIGLYVDEATAQAAYAYVDSLMQSPFTLDVYDASFLDFTKFIELWNFKNNTVYLRAPIYLCGTYFKYYLNPDLYFTFDMKDLFFFSNYRIHKRGNYFFINIGPRQENIMHRFGILNYATYGTDYITLNADPLDLRRENLKIINHYKGVQLESKFDKSLYVTRILTDQYIVVGHYDSEVQAAIAYNKAIDLLAAHTSQYIYEKNELPFLTRLEYQAYYDAVVVSKRLTQPGAQNRVISSKAYRGTSRDKNGYRALIGFRKKQIYLGTYPTEKRAAQAYNYASLYLYGGKGYVNEVSPITHEGDEHKIALKLQKADVLKHPLRSESF